MRGRALLGTCLAALFALAPASAEATNYVVNTTADNHVGDNACVPAPGDCTIRDAFTAANGADTITLPAGIYNINPQFQELDLTGATVVGAGARSTIIDGRDAARLLATSNDGTTAPQVSGVTFRNGFIGASAPGGGAILVSGTLGLSNSQVLSSTADANGGGINVQTSGRLVLTNSTVAGNESLNGQGGGIAVAAEGILAVANSTITGNTSDFDGGGIAFQGLAASIQNATIAGNTGDLVGGLISGNDITLRNTIVYGNAGAQCSIDGVVTQNNSLSQDTTCGLSGNGSIVGTNPGLGALANNGGPTDTRAIGATSIAFNHGGAGCTTTDQRGIARPQGGACDIGAYEFRPPRLTVVERVVNDQGGTQAPADFAIHVRRNGADVAGSPRPGSATGTAFSLAPGTYVVGEDADSRYTTSFSGCPVVTLAEGQAKTCTITNDDNPPVVGKVVNAAPERGTVKVQIKGKGKFHVLKEGEQLPNGTIVDTRKGRITLFAAADKNGGLSKADFYDGLFRLKQSNGKHPLTTLTLVEKLSCRSSAKKAHAARKKKKKRRLWGDGKGRYRTKAGVVSGTVRGTKWLTEDTCTTSSVRVKRGKVAVHDFVKRKTVLVKAGHKYVAHKP